MPTRNVSLTDHLDRFVEDGIASGRFGNASEVVREALRLMERRQKEQEAKIAWLMGAAQVGIEDWKRGDVVRFETDEEIDQEIDRMTEIACAKADTTAVAAAASGTRRGRKK